MKEMIYTVKTDGGEERKLHGRTIIRLDNTVIDVEMSGNGIPLIDIYPWDAGKLSRYCLRHTTVDGRVDK